MKPSDYDGRGYDPPYENDAPTLLRELAEQLEAEREMVTKLREAVVAAIELADTGSQRHKATFDPYDMDEIPAGWRVAEKMREVLLEAVPNG